MRGDSSGILTCVRAALHASAEAFVLHIGGYAARYAVAKGGIE